MYRKKNISGRFEAKTEKNGRRWSKEDNDVGQSCQTFLSTIYQNGGIYTKLPQNIYQMVIKYIK
jgi:hypothetical protein